MVRTASFVTAVAVLASVASATITTLAPGAGVTYPGGAGGEAPSFGVPAGLPLVTPFITTPLGNVSGVFTSNVYMNDPANPFGAGFMTFHYEVANSILSVNSIGRISNNGFAGFSTAVAWFGAGVNPWSQDRDPAADTMGHNFGSFLANAALTPGGFSTILVVHTNAPLFTIADSSIIDGDTATVPSYAPLPTPGAASLLGLGLIASSRRRRS